MESGTAESSPSNPDDAFIRRTAGNIIDFLKETATRDATLTTVQ